MVELLTAQELMQALKISRSTLMRLKKKGLPLVGAGKLARYHPEQALQWFHAHAQPATTSPKTLPPGDYECQKCGFLGAIYRPMTPSPCPKCGATGIPIRIHAPVAAGDKSLPYKYTT